MRPDPRRQYVYFIKPVDSAGPIKIGYSHIPFERLNVHMNWSPVKLEMLCWSEGGRGHERALHEKFAEFRSHCEWFWPVPEMLKGIARIKAGESLTSAFGLRIEAATGGKVQPADWYISEPAQ